MDLKDNEMRRSVTQALYKYLPGAWGDFYVKGTRTEFISKIKRWNSVQLIGINKERVIERVKECVVSFERSGGILDGFGDIDYINSEQYDVLTPKVGDNEGAIAEISPLVFFCNKCHKVRIFKNSLSVKLSERNVCKSKGCSGTLTQIPFVFTCKCGWDSPATVRWCKEHGLESMIYDGRYKFSCTKCSFKYELFKSCEKCKVKLTPTIALDSSNFIPFSFSIIDLVDNKDEKFLRDYIDKAAMVIVSNWLGKLDDDIYEGFIDNGIEESIDYDNDKEYIRQVEFFVKSGIEIEQAKDLARGLRGQSEDGFKKVKEDIETSITFNNDIRLKKCATSILEYQSIIGEIESKINKSDVRCIDYAQRVSKELNTTAGNINLKNVINKFGISNMYSTSNVPLVFCSYGFTRKKSEPSGGETVTLNAFKAEGKNKNVFGVKLLTEGIVIEFDRKRILDWLVVNKYITENELPIDLDNDNELKKWFLNNIDTSNISPFSSLDDDGYTNTATVMIYTLLHSIAHSFIKEAGQLCGLDKNSLSEFIFAEIPAIFIYCQNSQGLTLGSLSNLFEAYLDKWLKFTLESVQKCIFDPICLDRDRACSGCLYINEVSCTHFNKDLDRRVLIGHFDLNDEKKITGFWETLLWQ